MNFGTLKTSVAAYLHRTDLTALLPDFIDQARVRIGGDLRALSNHVTGTVTSFSVGRAALPTNWGQPVSVSLDGNPLAFMPVEQIGNYSRGVYTIDGGDLVVPEAGSTTSVDVTYYSISPVFVLDADVGVGMLEYPSIWLFASCAEAALYVQEYQLADTMNNAYMLMLATANRAGNDALFGPGAATVNDQPSIQGMAVL